MIDTGQHLQPFVLPRLCTPDLGIGRTGLTEIGVGVEKPAQQDRCRSAFHIVIRPEGVHDLGEAFTDCFHLVFLRLNWRKNNGPLFGHQLHRRMFAGVSREQRQISESWSPR